MHEVYFVKLLFLDQLNQISNFIILVILVDRFENGYNEVSLHGEEIITIIEDWSVGGLILKCQIPLGY